MLSLEQRCGSLLLSSNSCTGSSGEHQHQQHSQHMAPKLVSRAAPALCPVPALRQADPTVVDTMIPPHPSLSSRVRTEVRGLMDNMIPPHPSLSSRVRTEVRGLMDNMLAQAADDLDGGVTAAAQRAETQSHLNWKMPGRAHISIQQLVSSVENRHAHYAAQRPDGCDLQHIGGEVLLGKLGMVLRQHDCDLSVILLVMVLMQSLCNDN
jgi:hypothetical protein